MTDYLILWDGSMGNLTHDEGFLIQGSYLLDAALQPDRRPKPDKAMPPQPRGTPIGVRRGPYR